MHLSSDLALDEGESLVAVDVDVLLVVVGVVSIAAVWVLRVAVALDDAAAGRCAGESSRAGGEALGLAGTDVVGKTVAVVWVTHEDRRLDGLEGVAGQSGTSTAADGVVHDLTSLRVSDKDNLSARALLVVGSNGLDNRCGSLGSRVVVGYASAGRASTASWVHDGFGARTRVGGLDRVYKPGSGTVAIALGLCGLTSSEDVDLGAALTLSDLDRAGGGETNKESCCCGKLHVDFEGSGYCASD